MGFSIGVGHINWPHYLLLGMAFGIIRVRGDFRGVVIGGRYVTRDYIYNPRTGVWEPMPEVPDEFWAYSEPVFMGSWEYGDDTSWAVPRELIREWGLEGYVIEWLDELPSRPINAVGAGELGRLLGIVVGGLIRGRGARRVDEGPGIPGGGG